MYDWLHVTSHLKKKGGVLLICFNKEDLISIILTIKKINYLICLKLAFFNLKNVNEFHQNEMETETIFSHQSNDRKWIKFKTNTLIHIKSFYCHWRREWLIRYLLGNFFGFLLLWIVIKDNSNCDADSKTSDWPGVAGKILIYYIEVSKVFKG